MSNNKTVDLSDVNLYTDIQRSDVQPIDSEIKPTNTQKQQINNINIVNKKKNNIHQFIIIILILLFVYFILYKYMCKCKK
jgi:hypothetical protein